MNNTNPDKDTRDTVLTRDRWRCTRCGKPLDAGSIHHRRLRGHKWPGLNQPSNLLTLCGSGTTGCHGWVHAHPAQARELGFIVSAYNDNPASVPVCTWRGWITLDDTGGYERKEQQ